MELEDLRLAVYRSFAATGQAPTTATLAEQLGTNDAEINSGLEMLAHNRHVVLDGDAPHRDRASRSLRVPLGFSVMGTSTLWWGGCAWDSFALPQLLRDAEPMLVATRCPACDTPLAWNVGRDKPPAGRSGRALSGAGRADVGRRRTHVRQPAHLLFNHVHRPVARANITIARLRHGPGHTLATRGALVRRATRLRLRSPRAGRSRRVLS